MYYLGFPIGPDLNVGGYTDIWSYRVEIDNTSSVNTGQTINIRFDFEIGGTSIAYLDYDLVRDPNNGQIIYTQNELATKISKIIKDDTKIIIISRNLVWMVLIKLFRYRNLLFYVSTSFFNNCKRPNSVCSVIDIISNDVFLTFCI